MVKRGRKWKKRDRRGGDGKRELEKRKEQEIRRGEKGPEPAETNDEKHVFT